MDNCKHEKMITVSSMYSGDFIADEEPYRNGVAESLSDKDNDLINSLELDIGINICSSCEQIFIYPSRKVYINAEDMV